MLPKAEKRSDTLGDVKFEKLLNTLLKTLAEAKVSTLKDTQEYLDCEYWSITRLLLQYRWRLIHMTTDEAMCRQK